ncbi:MAG: hypothetical protein M3209_00245 [Acidobacteriota bacterium]|nr:hypothetical protein [Acidobacteriota bacterium]
MEKIKNLKLSREKVAELAEKVYTYADGDDERAQAILVLLAALTFEKDQSKREFILDTARNVIFPKTDAFFYNSNGFIEQAFKAAAAAQISFVYKLKAEQDG